MKDIPVLIIRKDNFQNQNGISSLQVSFGYVSEGSNKLNYYSYYSDRKDLDGLKIRTQWNTSGDTVTGDYKPYAMRPEYNDTDLKNFEVHYKAMKKIKKVLEDRPFIESFGMYVFAICEALKVKHFVTPIPQGYEYICETVNNITGCVDTINNIVVHDEMTRKPKILN